MAKKKPTKAADEQRVVAVEVQPVRWDELIVRVVQDEDSPGLLTNNPNGRALFEGLGRKVTPSPEEEAEAAAYRLDPPRDGCEFGIPAAAFQAAMVNAGPFVKVPKTRLRGIFRVLGGPDGLVPIETKDGKYEIVRHYVKVQGKQVARHRPLFRWSATLIIRYAPNFITPQSLINLLETAGQIIGVGDYRPERGGPYGTFRVQAE